jgi:hypothetical protein
MVMDEEAMVVVPVSTTITRAHVVAIGVALVNYAGSYYAGGCGTSRMGSIVARVLEPQA